MGGTLDRIDDPFETKKLGPGLVPKGYAETVLDRLTEIDDPAFLWAGTSMLGGLAQKWNGQKSERAEIKSAQMFCEIQLGQLLGPNPGQGPGRGKKGPNWDLSEIPKQWRSKFRRYYGHRDELIAAVREGKRSRNSLLLYVDELEAAQREQPAADDLDIRRGDFREVLADLEVGSTALVLTDPPYPAEYVQLWTDLGRMASRWLTDGGSLIAYSGQSTMPDALARLSEHLRYWWIIALLHSAGTQTLPGKYVMCGWKPLLWFVKDRRRNDVVVADRLKGTSPRKTIPTGDDEEWAQGVEEIAPLISALTEPGDLIVDPFAGSGSIGVAAVRYGRRFIGAELR